MKFLIMFTCMIFGSGFFMLLERKILGLIQFRFGPNKVLFKGWMQFINDFQKLLVKCSLDLNKFMYFLIFFIIIFLSLIQMFMWMMVPFESICMNTSLTILLLILMLTYKLMMLVFLIWLVYSSYSTLSVFRMVIQSISSDMVMIVFFLLLCYLNKKLNFLGFVSSKMMNFFMSGLILMIWIVVILIELACVPYDFFECESELISGFNTEFSSISFVMMILIEYLEMMYFMFLSVVLFFNFSMNNIFFFFLLSILTSLLITFRGVFIRYRYDKMLILLWMVLFPVNMLNSQMIILMVYI